MGLSRRNFCFLLGAAAVGVLAPPNFGGQVSPIEDGHTFGVVIEWDEIQKTLRTHYLPPIRDQLNARTILLTLGEP